MYALDTFFRSLALALVAVPLAACASEQDVETESVASSEQPYAEAPAAAEPEQGGCSNRQIGKCVGYCGGTVDACYGHHAHYACQCRSGLDALVAKDGSFVIYVY